MTEALYLIGSIQHLKMTVKRDDRDDNCYTHLAVRIVLKQENWFLNVVIGKCVRYSTITRKYKCVLRFGAQRGTVNKLLFNLLSFFNRGWWVYVHRVRVYTR
jgi:hypothetical protein